MANNFSMDINIQNLNLSDLNELYRIVGEWEENIYAKGHRPSVNVEYRDPVGGHHFDGQGIAPNQGRCGECNTVTCEECPVKPKNYWRNYAQTKKSNM